MGILRQPSVANLGEAKHPLDHPYDALLYLGTYPGLPAVFATLHLVHDAKMAVAFQFCDCSDLSR